MGVSLKTVFFMKQCKSNKKYISINLDDYSSYSTIEKNAFAFYMTLQVKFNNNIILKASYKRLEHLTKANRNSVMKYLRILKEWNMITYEGTTLHVIKQSKDEGKKFYKLHLYRSLSFRNMKAIMQIQLVKINIEQQVWHEYKKIISNSPRHSRKIREYLERLHKETILKWIVSERVFLSVRQLAKVIGISPKSVATLLKESKQKGIINYKQNLYLIAESVNYSYFLEFRKTFSEKFYYFKENSIFLYCGIKELQSVF